MSKENDPLLKTGEINKNDPEAYYPRNNPVLHHKKTKHIKRRPDLYEKDPKAYYGPISKYEIIGTVPKDQKKVKITLKDLSELNPSQEKIDELQSQLNNLNNFISLPKNMMINDKGRHPYYQDPDAYYDPTKADVAQKKKELKSKIALMKKNLSLMQANGGKMPEPFKYGNVKGKIYVENRDNVQKEAYNKYIKDMLGEEDSKKKELNPTVNVKYNSPNIKKSFRSKVQTAEEHEKSPNVAGITFRTISSNYDVSHKQKENTKKSEIKNESIPPASNFDKSSLKKEKKTQSFSSEEKTLKDGVIYKKPKIVSSVKGNNPWEVIAEAIKKNEKKKVKEEEKKVEKKTENKKVKKAQKENEKKTKKAKRKAEKKADKKEENKKEKKAEKKEENKKEKKAEKKPEKKAEIKANRKTPDSQGLKTERVKIIHRKRLE
jgi:hypothetical protein